MFYCFYFTPKCSEFQVVFCFSLTESSFRFISTIVTSPRSTPTSAFNPLLIAFSMRAISCCVMMCRTEYSSCQLSCHPRTRTGCNGFQVGTLWILTPCHPRTRTGCNITPQHRAEAIERLPPTHPHGLQPPQQRAEGQRAPARVATAHIQLQLITIFVRKRPPGLLWAGSLPFRGTLASVAQRLCPGTSRSQAAKSAPRVRTYAG